MVVAFFARGGALALPAALTLLAFFVPAASAAECTPTVPLAHDGHIGSLQFKQGEYRIGVPSNSRMSCVEASAAFGRFAHQVNRPLPPGWDVRPSTRTFTYRGRTAFEVTALAAAGGGGASLWNRIQDFAVIWLPIIFM